MNRVRPGLSFLLLLLAASLSCGTCGCERVNEVVDHLTRSMKRGKGADDRGDTLSDRERVLRKYGEPKERQGIGKTVRTENGVRHNRKWNYYYGSAKSDIPTMRTVYFVDDEFTGSVIRRPDGTITREEIRFAY